MWITLTQTIVQQENIHIELYSQFVDMVHVQRNRSPTRVFQNSTYQTYLKTSENKKLQIAYIRE